MHVVSNDGRLLFSGSRHDCKQFIRKNNVKQYKLKEQFIEKIIVKPPFGGGEPFDPKPDPQPPVYPEETEEPETFFNRVFTTTSE